MDDAGGCFEDTGAVLSMSFQRLNEVATVYLKVTRLIICFTGKGKFLSLE